MEFSRPVNFSVAIILVSYSHFISWQYHTPFGIKSLIKYYKRVRMPYIQTMNSKHVLLSGLKIAPYII